MGDPPHHGYLPLSYGSMADVTEPNAALKSFKLPGDILHITFHPSGNHFAVTCTITSRDEAFFFWRSEETGEWVQRDDIGLGGSMSAVDGEEVSPRYRHTSTAAMTYR